MSDERALAYFVSILMAVVFLGLLLPGLLPAQGGHGPPQYAPWQAFIREVLPVIYFADRLLLPRSTPDAIQLLAGALSCAFWGWFVAFMFFCVYDGCVALYRWCVRQWGSVRSGDDR